MEIIIEMYFKIVNIIVLILSSIGTLGVTLFVLIMLWYLYGGRFEKVNVLPPSKSNRKLLR
jgi:hypothetical protein